MSRSDLPQSMDASGQASMHSQDGSQRKSRRTFWLAVVALSICGGIYALLVLCVFVRAEVPAGGGDAIIKLLWVSEFLDQPWRYSVTLGAPEWLQRLWTDEPDYFPITSPWAAWLGSRHFIAFPLPFLIVTSPFVAILGQSGVYVLPILGFTGAVVVLCVLSRQVLGTEKLEVLSGGLLIFASPLLFYGTSFSEHAPAMFVQLVAIVLLRVPPNRVPARSSAIGGALLGVSAWFRPEAAVFAGCFLAARTVIDCSMWRSIQAWAAFILGLTAFGIWNFTIYGAIGGAHAAQMPAMISLRLYEHARITAHLMLWLLQYAPFFWVNIAIWIALYAFAPSSVQQSIMTPHVRILMLSSVGYSLFVGGFVPNIGGYQYGPRYLLIVFPIAIIISLKCVEIIKEIRILIGIVFLVAIYFNAFGLVSFIYQENAQPLHRFAALEDSTRQVVLVTNDWGAIVFAHYLGKHELVLVRDSERFSPVANVLAANGIDAFYVLSFAPPWLERPGVPVSRSPLAGWSCRPFDRSGTSVTLDRCQRSGRP